LAPTLDHIDLVVSDLERSLAFYRGLLRPLGWTHEGEIEGERGERVVYLGGKPPDRPVAVSLRERQSDANPLPYDRYAVGIHHVAFEATSRAEVDDRADWARNQGVELESEPQEYAYTPGYYAVFFPDPDGIKLEVVYKPTRQRA
jgi:catechol 2,3-dioxygenase-like lactoylglutathione lyase family enzyme